MTDLERFSTSEAKGTDNVVFGQCFAFLGAGALDKAGFSWLSKVLKGASSSETRIIPLLGSHKIDMFGVSVTPRKFSQIDLTTIVSDKSLYRADKNNVHLLVIDAQSANTSRTVQILLNGNSFSREHVRLGANGEGQLILRDLPVGEFEVKFDDKKESKTSCKFNVAEYRLVPLVVSVQKSEISGKEQLSVVLRVESFGTPVSGKLKIDLMDNYHKIESVSVKATAGTAKASFKLTGRGPHSLNVQMEDEPGKTATAPLRGSREEERSQTIFSRLGNEVHGSLLAQQDSHAVRGLHLVDGGLRTAPISLVRVDDDAAHLKVNSKIEGLRIVVVDPSFPQAGDYAIDPSVNRHPETYDPRYKDGERLFKEGRIETALQVFVETRNNTTNPHPYYAYWIACCLAKLDKRDEAVQYLRMAIVDGWNDFNHMENDADLISLHGFAPYEELKNGGMREFNYDNVSAGQEIELDTFDPVSVLLLGAFVDGHPWEGWATVVSPSAVSVESDVKEDYKSGEEVRLSFDLSFNCRGDAMHRPAAKTAAKISASAAAPTSLYVVVKDARLLSTDTPESQLAACLKSYVESSTKDLNIGKPTQKLTDVLARVSNPYPAPGGFSQMEGSGSWGSGSYGSSPFRGSGARLALSAPPPMAGASPPAAPAPAAPQQAGWGGSIREVFGAVAGAFGGPAGGAGADSWAAPTGQFDMAAEPNIRMKSLSINTLEEPSPTPTAAPSVTPLISEEPEVLFAGFIKLDDGKGHLTVLLPDYFNDYIVETFALSGLHWSYKESRFKASKDPFVHLTLPVFARKEEETIGIMQVSSHSSPVTVRLLKDGQEVELKNGKDIFKASEPIKGSIALQFNAEPGEYQAVLESGGEVVERVVKRVQEPGKLKRRVRTLQILEAGKSIARKDDPGIDGLSLMPGLDAPFKVLVDATADYGHACCEQTAAKIMAACAMYMFANGDDSRRKNAESIIIAGIRREKLMWLKGRGFKAYPEVPDEPNPHYGRMATRHLWNLELIRTTGSGGLSANLAKAIDEGLEMAFDATQAYNMSWPPSKLESCEDAYNVVRYSTNVSTSAALDLVKKYATKDKGKAPVNPHLGRYVHARVEDAYAAATLFRAGGTELVRTALELTNNVVSQFNEQGRLYSTCDSVAAIALMSELTAAKITGGSGTVEVNGRSIKVADALNSTEALETIKVLEGVANVAIDRIIEEDWSKYGADVEMTVQLNKNGRHQTNLIAGDSVDLIVKIDGGYKDGDLLWVCLPDALSRVVGGGQVKMFSVDFCGSDHVKIPLAATGITGGAGSKSQSMAVCIRNMFIEERVGSPGLIAIAVKES